MQPSRIEGIYRGSSAGSNSSRPVGVGGSARADTQFAHAQGAADFQGGSPFRNVAGLVHRDISFAQEHHPGLDVDVDILGHRDCHLAHAEARVDQDDTAKSLRKKYEAWYYLYKNEYWRAWIKMKPDIKDPKNFRLLTICDMKAQEFENLIEMVRKIDERGRGLKLTWFIRWSDLEETITESKEKFGKQGRGIYEKIVSRDSIMNFFGKIWRTPVAADELYSILT